MRILANLKEGDLVAVVFHDRLPLPEVDTLEVIRESERQKLAKAGALLSGNKGWLVMESDLFTLINSLNIGEKPSASLPNNYIINLTLLEIKRYKRKWSIITAFSTLCMKLKSLLNGKSLLKV